MADEIAMLLLRRGADCPPRAEIVSSMRRHRSEFNKSIRRDNVCVQLNCDRLKPDLKVTFFVTGRTKLYVREALFSESAKAYIVRGVFEMHMSHEFNYHYSPYEIPRPDETWCNCLLMEFEYWNTSARATIRPKYDDHLIYKADYRETAEHDFDREYEKARSFMEKISGERKIQAIGFNHLRQIEASICAAKRSEKPQLYSVLTKHGRRVATQFLESSTRAKLDDESPEFFQNAASVAELINNL